MSLTKATLPQTEYFKVRTYDTDLFRKTTPNAIIKMMHEGAMQNVIRIGLSYWDLLPHQITWILMRKQMKIYRMPEINEEVRLLTYPSGFEKFFTYRDYHLYDADEKLLASSVSTWLLMDLNTRKMTRIPEFISDKYLPLLPDPQDCLPRATERLPPFDREPDAVRKFTVGWYDQDFNKHLSNVYFVGWMLEAVPEETLRHQKLESFVIHYRFECRYGDGVSSEILELGNNQFLHRLVNQRTGQVAALGRSQWQ